MTIDLLAYFISTVIGISVLAVILVAFVPKKDEGDDDETSSR